VRVHIAELLGDPSAVRRVQFTEAFAAPADDVVLLGPVAGELALTGTGRTVSLRGRLHTRARLICGACLRSFPQALEFSVDEEFARARPPEPGAGRGEAALGPDDFVVAVGADDTIDLSEVVRQHLLLALPIAPRCREDCRGLCPRCGADLNAAPCACARREPDPRLRALARWSPASGTPRV
jgi:uncharacterized protein